MVQWCVGQILSFIDCLTQVPTHPPPFHASLPLVCSTMHSSNMWLKVDEYRLSYSVLVTLFLLKTDWFEKGHVTHFSPMRCKKSLKRERFQGKVSLSLKRTVLQRPFLQHGDVSVCDVWHLPQPSFKCDKDNKLRMIKQSEGTQTHEEHPWAEEFIKPAFPYHRTFCYMTL